MRPRRLVACPRRFPHASHLASAFAERDTLAAYVTGFVPPRWLAASWLPAPGWARASLAARRLELPARGVVSIPWLDVVRPVLSRAGLPGGADLAWEVEDRLFGLVVARSGIIDQVDVLHCFEHSALELFERARARGVRTVLHMPSPHPRFMVRVLDEALAREPALDDQAALGWFPGRRPRRNARRERELALADLVVTNSRFSARTFIEEGVPAERVISIPLGGPPPPPTPGPGPGAGPLRVLFAGALALHKGIHVLLRAWSGRAASSRAGLTLAGSLAVPRQLLDRPGVEWRGPVGHGELLDLMGRSDLLVLPSLADGYGVVVAEALGRGTPVLTTTHVGAADLIDEGRTGWVVPAGDVEALAARLRWADEHVAELRTMRSACRASVTGHSWLDFRARLLRELDAAGI